MNHPYRNIPDRQRWSRAMAHRAVGDVDPVLPPASRIRAEDRLVTAGSCFAQHVSRWLRQHGRPCFETETAHPLLGDELARAFGYGIYAARYGNVYTARQLLQLWRRAHGRFVPADDVWEHEGAWYDPFRPTIQQHGFSSRREYDADRRQHFAAVRRAFGEADVLVFTLGLTECWASREDGAVYPLCPGVAAGRFDADRHEFLNLSVDEVVADLRAFRDEVREVNPDLRLVLTVSPVPLAATAEPRHVLVSNTVSKAVLRVAADMLSRSGDAYYFPACEIIQGAGTAFFASDRRSVNEAGVDRVMQLFSRHVLEPGSLQTTTSAAPDEYLARAREVVDAMCDEERLDPAAGAGHAESGHG